MRSSRRWESTLTSSEIKFICGQSMTNPDAIHVEFPELTFEQFCALFTEEAMVMFDQSVSELDA